MTPSSVLVIKPSSLGDIVHTLPAVHFLKTTFRDADFYWIANSEWRPLLQDNADLKAVIPFPRSRFRGASGIVEFVRWCSEISHLEPHLVLDFQGLIRSAWIARSAKGRRILGLSDAREAAGYHYHERNPDAWIWKNQRIDQVRAIADEVRSKRSRGRPNLFQLAKFVHRRLLQ